MANLFRSIPLRKPKRNFFDLSHEVLMTAQQGVLYPFLVEPIVPGDKFKVQTEILCRMAPTLAPIFSRVNIYTHFFFVPNRLIWNKWEDFITRGASGTDAPIYPTYTVGNVSSLSGPALDPLNGSALLHERSLADYLGFPCDWNRNVDEFDAQAQNKTQYDALPFRAYALVYDEYYRDQNLQAPLTRKIFDRDGSPVEVNQGTLIGFESGNQAITLASTNYTVFNLRSRAWEKDYFTSALPWPQRGNDVQIPFGSSSAPVVYSPDTSRFGVFRTRSGTSFETPSGDVLYGSSGSVTPGERDIVIDGKVVDYDPRGSLKADLSSAVGATINDLRRSIKLQEFYEKDARGGSRYIEKILSHFGVRSSDARLQRPEYLGGGVSPIVISEVLQQSESSKNSPLGSMAGHGVSAQVTHQFKRRFEEHGLIIGIISIMPKAVYMNGMPRKYMKRDFFDFYWPEFANLGEQPIYNQELYNNEGSSFDPTNPSNINGKVFGYTPRYAEYKFSPGRVHGDFRTNLSFWHLGRNFISAPTLSGEFVSEKPSTRIFPVTDEYLDHFWLDIYNKVHALRPMPKFGVPII